jgi:hypothetical protein
MSGPTTSVFLPAGQKTQVIYSSFVFQTYNVRFGVGNLSIDWERNSTLPPWHTWGTHNSSSVFGATVAGAYCNFWMTSPQSQTVTIAPA